MRPKTTGIYKTRAELVDKIRFLYFETNLSLERIGHRVGVSQCTASKIIDNAEWNKLQDADYFPTRPQPKPVKDRPLTLGERAEIERWTRNEKQARGDTCGSGYMPTCSVHLPSRELEQALFDNDVRGELRPMTPSMKYDLRTR